MTRHPRFEVCHGDSGWWARFRAANGRVVWVTETYRRRREARKAITGYVDAVTGGWWYLSGAGRITMSVAKDAERNQYTLLASLEVREVDERC